jgi:xylan 1,4-beta-xylosidase
MPERSSLGTARKPPLGAALTLCLALALAASAWLAAPPAAALTAAPEWQDIEIDARAAGTPLPHFWEQMFGSGRAILSLRESYRADLSAVKDATAFRYVRFHNIFHDEVGIVERDARGRARYNFSYVDQIYDGLLAHGVRPFVEIGFMPTALSSKRGAVMAFWYHPNVAPPRSWRAWDDLVRHFAAHLVERYGIDEVSQWYFEVWNEPNLDFWQGRPRQRSYFELYAHTARDLKASGARLRVGGPATAQAAWVADFLRYAAAHDLPVDFVSSHVYADDPPKAVFGTAAAVSRDTLVCRAVHDLRAQIASSAYPRLPLIVSEYNASYKNDPDVTDSVFMGPWLADTIRQCAGAVDMMSYWTFSDVFEEKGVIRTPFYGGFGLIAEHGILKPGFHAFALLHKLGDEQLANASHSALVTRRADGTLVIALWNYHDPEPFDPGNPTMLSREEVVREAHLPLAAQTIPTPPPPNPIRLRIAGLPPSPHFTLWRLDTEHGDARGAFQDMGSPASPTSEQIERLRAAAQLPPPVEGVLAGGSLELTVPRQGLVLIEVAPSPAPPDSPR